MKSKNIKEKDVILDFYEAIQKLALKKSKNKDIDVDIAFIDSWINYE